jgi:hypothetical protein
MKSTPPTLLTLLAALAAISSLHADADFDLPHITVYGSAVTEVAPDLMRWQLEVVNRGADVAAVAAEHAARTTAVLAYLKEAGILPTETHTARMHIRENWVTRNNQRVQEGFRASTNVTFTASDLTAYQDLWIGLSQLDGVDIDYVSWDSSQRVEVRNKTRIDALHAARAKAAAMAAALGCRIAEPLAIEEEGSFAQSGSSGRYTRDSNVAVALERVDAADAGEAASPGAIAVQARVKVVFRLVTE